MTTPTLDRPAIHTFVPSPTGARVIENGTSWPACAECGAGVRRGHKRASPVSRARPEAPASTDSPLSASALRAPGADRVPVIAPHDPPWQLRALALMLDEALRADVSYATRIQLLDAQRAVRSELAPSTVRHAPAYVEQPAPAPVEPREPRRDPSLSAGLSTIARGIRSDQMRRLFQRAVGAGWSPRVLGSGHLKLTSPTGSSFTLSMTSDGGARAYKNDRAQAKRAGLDVAGL